MIKIWGLYSVLILVLIGACQQARHINLVGTDPQFFELTDNAIDDSTYLVIMNSARKFVLDSLNEQILDFKYRIIHDQDLTILELFDKRLEIRETSEFNPSIVFVSLENTINLYFDSLGNYQYNRSVMRMESKY